MVQHTEPSVPVKEVRIEYIQREEETLTLVGQHMNLEVLRVKPSDVALVKICGWPKLMCVVQRSKIVCLDRAV